MEELVVDCVTENDVEPAGEDVDAEANETRPKDFIHSLSPNYLHQTAGRDREKCHRQGGGYQLPTT